jgi:hypothetical protein
VTNTQIDDAIFSAVDGNWRKVAMVIAKASDALGAKLPQGDNGLGAIAARIEALVRDGRLVAQGDINQWRHGEVRRP